MEDAHCHEFPTKANANIGFVGVFDGHAGDAAAKYAASSVGTFIQNSESFRFVRNKMDPAILARATMEGFFDCDEAMKQLPQFKVDKNPSGCTGVVSLLTKSTIIVGNCGDSRCVLVRGDQPIFATRDHKPSDEREKQRVEQAGGRVVYGRINGDLASARSFGDFRYKKDPSRAASLQQVTVQPDIIILDREPSDQLLILACDGIWDVMSNLECAHFILAALRLGATLSLAADLVLEECLRKSSGDNMSILIVALDDAPEQMGSIESGLTLDQVRDVMYDSVL